MLLVYAGVGKSNWEMGYHQNERISWRSLVLLRIYLLGGANIRRDCIGGYSRYSASGLLLALYILKILYQVNILKILYQVKK
jgi:hypothetical protein